MLDVNVILLLHMLLFDINQQNLTLDLKKSEG